MSFGNHKPERHGGHDSRPHNDGLDQLDQLGGLNDLMGPTAQGNLERLAHDGNQLGHDLKHPSLDKAGLDHALGDVGKFADDLNKSPLGKLDNLAGDLAANDANGQAGNADNAKPGKPDNDLAALNDLGNVGSLASQAAKAERGQPHGSDLNPADALKDASNLADDLKHNQPHNLAKNVGKLGKEAGLGALSFGPMEDTAFGNGKNPLDHPLDRKVANGSIMPADLRNQRGNDSYHPRPPKTLLDRLKDGGKFVGRKFKDGLKSAFSHATSGVMSAVHHLTGASIAKTTAAKIVASGLLVPALAGGGLIGVAINQDNNYQVLDAGNICGVANDNGMGEADADGAVGSTGGGGDFKTSAIARKHAKSVFMAWVHLGLSGAAASGIVGWTNSEGGFGILDRAEGHYGNDEKTNGIAYGVAPINDHGGGGGIYQFTPYTKFAGLNDKKWLSAHEQNQFVLKSLKGGDWIASYDLTGKNHSFKEFAHEKDPGDAALEWQAYERGQVSAGSDVAQRKIADAKWIYKHFNGSRYQADDSLLGKIAGGMADANSAIAETINNLMCKGDNGNGGPAVAGSWGKPFAGFNRGSISSPFGPRDMGWHDGIDIGTANHTGVIRAIHGGKVTKIGSIGHTQNDLGYFIIVQSPDGYSEIYQEFAFSMADGKKVSKVKVGDTVKTGQPICELSPSTPNCTHIHIGVFKGSGSQLFSDGIPHSFTPNYPKWKDPAKLILG